MTQDDVRIELARRRAAERLARELIMIWRNTGFVPTKDSLLDQAVRRAAELLAGYNSARSDVTWGYVQSILGLDVD